MTSQVLLWTTVLGVLQVFGPRVGEGSITETTWFNRPPLSFACSPHGGSAPTLCSAAANDKTYVQVQSIVIYRDYSNEVGACLEPEKQYIARLLQDWFNFDCKMENIEKDAEYKRMPISLLQDAMTKYCGIANPDVARIVVNYECVKNLANVMRNDMSGIPPRPPVATGPAASQTKTVYATSSASLSNSMPMTPPTARTPSHGQPGSATGAPISGSSGGVVETTASNRPPFSFACGTKRGGSATTLCGSTGDDKKYVLVESVEIYRDYSNEVRKCLDPEKYYIAQLLTDWFNYDCQEASAERNEENKKMPIELLKDAMTKHCVIANPDVARIVVNYGCVRTPVDATSRLPGVLWNGTQGIPPRPPVKIGEAVSTTKPIATSSTSKAAILMTSTARTPSDGQPDSAATRSPLGSSGGVIETTVFNQPPLSFACWSKLDGGTSTFCGTTGNNTYMSIDRVEIYRDNTKQVGHCLNPEKTHIKQLLGKWFNYDCKLSIVERGSEVQRMPVDTLRVAMTLHCGIVFPNVFKIVAHYECVKETQPVKSGALGVRSNGSSN